MNDSTKSRVGVAPVRLGRPPWSRHLGHSPAGAPGAIHVPERDDHVQPTGRDEPGDYTPNDRLMGSDR